MSEQLLYYYNEQLSYLRKQGRLFSAAHPKIAENLNFGTDDCDDPFVNRLLEGFAFLAGRVQHNIEQGNQTTTENLLNLFYPHLQKPLPAFSILQFEPKHQLEQLLIIPKHTCLRIPLNSYYCTFRTVYPIYLTPLKIVDIKWSSSCLKKTSNNNLTVKSCLSFKLQSLNSNVSIHKLNLTTLRIYINLEKHLAYSLYEILNTELAEIIISINTHTSSQIKIPNNSLKFVGFSHEDIILPYPKNSNNAYGLLTEFFAYPMKFMFFDLEGLAAVTQEEFTELEVHIYLKVSHGECEKAIDSTSLLLNCTPIINLFPLQGEPIRIDDSQLEYQIISDHTIPVDQIEVYSVESMEVSSSDHASKSIVATEYFGKSYTMLENDAHLYWRLRYKKCWELGEYHLPGTEAFVAFSMLKQNSITKQLIAIPNLLCTNRNSTAAIPLGVDNPKFEFYPKMIEYVDCIKTIIPITKAYYREKSLDIQLLLLTHIAINKFCYDNNSDSTKTLKDTLRIYNFHNKSDILLINKGIEMISTRPIITRNPAHLKQGFCQGIEYILKLDENYFTEKNVFLFAEVLNYFLQQMCSINSFVQLVLESTQRGIIKTWKPMLGTRKIL